MTGLLGMRTMVRQVLGDLAAARYDDELLDEALRRALVDYSQVLPQVKVTSLLVAVSGREQDISTLQGLIGVLEVNCPFTDGDETPAVRSAWALFQRGGQYWLHIQGQPIPQAGDLLRITYTCAHTILELDGAEDTTLVSAAESLLVHGAAGKAARMRALQLVEAHGARSTEPTRLEAWAERQEADFFSRLAALKQTQLYPLQSPEGWKLDGWDGKQGF